MRGTKTPPDKVEEIKALSLIHSPQVISQKLGVPLRTIYGILAKRDNPKIESRREEKRLEVVDNAFAHVDQEVQELRSKMDMILAAIEPERIARARLTELTTAYGTLFDKRQLLTGKPTHHIASISKLVMAAHEPPRTADPATDVTPDRKESTKTADE